MGELANAFSASGMFDLVSLTKSYERLPINPTWIGDMNIFATKGITTTTAVIEEKNGRLALIPESLRGGPGTVSSAGKRTVRPLIVGHIQVDGGLEADDVLGNRAFGSETNETLLASKINEELVAAKRHIDVTNEYRRVGALHGKILDADGSSVLTNFFTEFGVSETTVDFAFATAATKVRGLCLTVKRAMDLAVGNSAIVTGVKAICGATFFNALIDHQLVRDTYTNWEAAVDLRGDPRRSFLFGGIEFQEYTATVSGNAFVNASQCRFFPIGQGLYETYFAPAPYIETVNTVGLEAYAKSKVRDFETGVDMQTQSNPLPVPFFPTALIKGTMS